MGDPVIFSSKNKIISHFFVNSVSARNERGPLKAICKDCVVVKKSRSGNLRTSLAKPCGIGHVIIELIDDPMILHI